MFSKGKHFLKDNKKKWILFLSLVLILVISVSATLAYMLVPTEEYPYEMSAAAVTLQPIVTKDADSIPTNIIVKNVGNVDARVRIQIVPMYRNTSNGSIYWETPKLGTDFSLECNNPVWVRLYDEPTYYGTTYYTYYYDALLAVGQQSADMLTGNGIQQLTTPPKGFALYFDVLVDGIQHVPNDEPANEAWSVLY